MSSLGIANYSSNYISQCGTNGYVGAAQSHVAYSVAIVLLGLSMACKNTYTGFTGLAFSLTGKSNPWQQHFQLAIKGLTLAITEPFTSVTDTSKTLSASLKRAGKLANSSPSTSLTSRLLATSMKPVSNKLPSYVTPLTLAASALTAGGVVASIAYLTSSSAQKEEPTQEPKPESDCDSTFATELKKNGTAKEQAYAACPKGNDRKEEECRSNADDTFYQRMERIYSKWQACKNGGTGWEESFKKQQQSYQEQRSKKRSERQQSQNEKTDKSKSDQREAKTTGGFFTKPEDYEGLDECILAIPENNKRPSQAIIDNCKLLSTLPDPTTLPRNDRATVRAKISEANQSVFGDLDVNEKNCKAFKKERRNVSLVSHIDKTSANCSKPMSTLLMCVNNALRVIGCS